MRKRLPKAVISGFLLLVVCLLGFQGIRQLSGKKSSHAVTLSTVSKESSDESTSYSATSSTSATTGYPDLSEYTDLSVSVSTEKQQLDILSEGTVIFETSVSTGAADSPTPKGNFVIEAERGDFFYNASSGEGAYYWVSFKDHGVYLFHSIPTDEEGNEIPEEASRLGTPSSHGCVRLRREDAKWFYESIPQGTPVTVD